jgi:MFS family permease
LNFGSGDPSQAAPSGDEAPGMAISGAERQWMAYYVTVRSLALAIFVGFLPVVFFYNLGIDIRLFGVVLGTLTLFAYISGRYGVKFLRRMPDRAVAPLSLGGLAIALAVFAVAPNLGLASIGMALLGLVNGVVRPLTMARLNSIPGRAPAERRLILGRMERTYGMANAAALVIGGFVALEAGIGTALWTLSIAAVCVGLGLALYQPARPAAVPI